MKKGFLLPSSVEKKKKQQHSGSASSSSADSEENPKSEGVGVLLLACDRDAIVEFTHLPCRTQITRTVSKLAMEKGVVVVRCSGCHKLIPVAGHAHNWFREQSHDKVEMFLIRSYGPNVLPKGSHSSFCATLKIPTPADLNNQKAKGDYVIGLRKERDRDVVYIHQACKTNMVRKVSREAYERGVVLARCHRCNKLCCIVDRVGYFGPLAKPWTLKGFLSKFMTDLKKGTEDTFCVTEETPENFYSKNHE